jgi:hypothetical protein
MELDRPIWWMFQFSSCPDGETKSLRKLHSQKSNREWKGKNSQRFIGLWDTERVIYDDLRGSGRFWIALRPRCPILRQGAEPSNLDRMGWSGTGVQREIPVSYGKVL